MEWVLAAAAAIFGTALVCTYLELRTVRRERTAANKEIAKHDAARVVAERFRNDALADAARLNRLLDEVRGLNLDLADAVRDRKGHEAKLNEQIEELMRDRDLCGNRAVAAEAQLDEARADVARERVAHAATRVVLQEQVCYEQRQSIELRADLSRAIQECEGMEARSRDADELLTEARHSAIEWELRATRLEAVQAECDGELDRLRKVMQAAADQLTAEASVL